MKKVIFLFFVLVFAISLTACSSQIPEGSSNSYAPDFESTNETPATERDSFVPFDYQSFEADRTAEQQDVYIDGSVFDIMENYLNTDTNRVVLMTSDGMVFVNLSDAISFAEEDNIRVYGYVKSSENKEDNSIPLMWGMWVEKIS